MIKSISIKNTPVIFIVLFILYASDINAAESVPKGTKGSDTEVALKINSKHNIEKGGFLKRIFRNISEKVKETKQRITKKIKRKISKKQARKNRTKLSLKKRNKNLFNILTFSLIFFLIAGTLIFLLLNSFINYTLFLVLSIIISLTAIVIALIYFSGRYVIKPHY